MGKTATGYMINLLKAFLALQATNYMDNFHIQPIWATSTYQGKPQIVKEN